MDNGTQKAVTYFGSPERSSEMEIKEEHDKILSMQLFTNTLDTLQEILLIINQNRQIIYLNNAIFKILGPLNAQTIYGLRPGEVFHCKHAATAPSGCGTSEHCKACGWMNAVLDIQKSGTSSEREYRLTNEAGEAVELKVTATFLEAKGENFIKMSFADISDEKRRQALERIFFHDIMNIAGGIQGISSMLNSSNTTGKIKDLSEMIMTASNSLIDEIKAQKQLKMAERGELSPTVETLDSLRIIKDLAMIYSSHEVAEEKTITMEPLEHPIEFQNDKTILMRVLGNMLKNALEATPSGGKVKIGCVPFAASGELEFYVSNTAYIPYEAQLQMFQRSFSTKGEGRGLGTYSMKLLGEKYLKGQVGFQTGENSGTTFFLRLKKSKDQKNSN